MFIFISRQIRCKFQTETKRDNWENLVSASGENNLVQGRFIPFPVANSGLLEDSQVTLGSSLHIIFFSPNLSVCMWWCYVVCAVSSMAVIIQENIYCSLVIM